MTAGTLDVQNLNMVGAGGADFEQSGGSVSVASNVNISPSTASA